jgi:hypothetical protein
MTTNQEKDYINTTYPFQVWLTTIVIVAPFIITLHGVLQSNYHASAEDVGLLIVTVFLGLILSLPVFIIHYVLFIFLTKKRLRALGIKLTLCITCLIGVFLTFRIIGDTSEHNFSILYSTSIILPSFIFKIYQNKPAIL